MDIRGSKRASSWSHLTRSMSRQTPRCFRLFLALLTTAIFFALQALASAQTATLTTLTRFSGTSGNHPRTTMIVGADGNFYGTTATGGLYNGGTLFQITPAGVQTILHHFSPADGTVPSTSLIQGTDGNFYGATSSEGANNSGTVFQVTAAGRADCPVQRRCQRVWRPAGSIRLSPARGWQPLWDCGQRRCERGTRLFFG